MDGNRTQIYPRINKKSFGSMNNQVIIDELGLKPSNGNWYSMKCPFCGQKKFGVVLDENGSGSYNCFRASCGNSGNLYTLLKKLGRTNLYQKRKEHNLAGTLESPFEKEKQKENLECPEISYPMGFRLVEPGGLPYLNERKLNIKQYIKFEVGKCKDPFYKGYILFPLKENGKLVGFLGRSTKSKQWHKDNPDVPRYKNSRGVDFSKIIGNYDSITEEIDTVIIVEGIFDAIRVEQILYEIDNEKNKK